MMEMMQNEHKSGEVRVLQKGYELDTLGAPFKVVLLNSFSFAVDQKTGEETVSIKDWTGLINAVVRARIWHVRKLNGDEIRFIRKAIGVRANLLSKFLDMTPEHFSRCENGTKTMSNQCERLFRLFTFLASYCDNPEDLLQNNVSKEELNKLTEKQKKDATEFLMNFLSLKVEPIFNSEDKLCFAFARNTLENGINGDDDKWSVGCECVAA
jgi:DNA-binding transcriptional regulator YiaG